MENENSSQKALGSKELRSSHGIHEEVVLGDDISGFPLRLLSMTEDRLRFRLFQQGKMGWGNLGKPERCRRS
jgi:hypothetical protein